MEKNKIIKVKPSDGAELSPQEMEVFNNHLVCVKKALDENSKQLLNNKYITIAYMMHSLLNGECSSKPAPDPNDVRWYFTELFKEIGSGGFPAVRDEFNKINKLSQGSFRQMAWAVAYKMSDKQIQVSFK